MTEADNPRKSFVCKGCGANLLFVPGLQSLKCEFCGTIHHLTADYDKIDVAETSALIVPMKVEEKSLELAVYEYMAQGKYTPDDMIETSRFVKFERLYAPFYRFTGQYEGTWSASFGYNRSEPYTSWEWDGRGGRQGVTRYQTVTDWSPASGSLRGSIVLVGYAGSRLNANVATLIERSEAIADATSDTRSYIAGIEVEAFQKSERDTYAERSKDLVDKIIEADVKSKAQGDAQRDWNWRSDYQKESTSVLMPVCHVVFEYNQQSYELWSDGTNTSRFVADPLPEDNGRKSAIAVGFAPFGVTLALAAIGCAVLANDPTTPPQIYWGMGLATLVSLIFGPVRRWSLLDYSRRLRESVFNFQKASSTNVDWLSDTQKSDLLTSFQKPTRSWLASTKPAAILVPTLLSAATIVVIASAPYWYSFPRPATSASPPTSGPREYGSANDGLLCRDALNQLASDWDTLPSYKAAVDEARRRRYSVSDCRNFLTGTSSPNTAAHQPAPSPSSPTNVASELRRRTLDFIANWYGIVSGPNSGVLAASTSIYADRVDYFGKSLSREEVLAELQRFDDRWPSRDYRAKQNSIEVDCDEPSMTCTVKGLLDFDSRSPARNERSWGVATFRYAIKFESPTASPKIVKESGEVTERHLESLPSSSRASAPETLCDDLAANPTDPNKLATVRGIPYDDLRPRAASAIESCEVSIAQYPNELRFQYQLARALAFTDRRHALEILQRTANAGYPASFDNIGWIYYSDLKNPAQAVQYFLQGVRLGDADAMISLAEMIGRGHFLVPNPVESRIALYKKASELGSATASRALEIEIGKSQQRLTDAERQRMMADLFRLFLSNLPRH